mmetsp:Transcript_16844/g.32873  ORF Transcript_16844/g.32873 Transcript_16844/m.32873 type:complete len:178 (+) Transcript_16844:1232-1765(+)
MFFECSVASHLLGQVGGTLTKVSARSKPQKQEHAGQHADRDLRPSRNTTHSRSSARSKPQPLSSCGWQDHYCVARLQFVLCSEMDDNLSFLEFSSTKYKFGAKGSAKRTRLSAASSVFPVEPASQTWQILDPGGWLEERLIWCTPNFRSLQERLPNLQWVLSSTHTSRHSPFAAREL